MSLCELLACKLLNLICQKVISIRLTQVKTNEIFFLLYFSQVDRVLARRQAGPNETEYLVRWRGCDSDQDSWESSDSLGPNGHTLITEFNESTGRSPPSPTVTRRLSLRSRSTTPNMSSSSTRSPPAATEAGMNHIGGISDAKTKETLVNSPGALLPAGGSRWALRRFSHDSTVSGASSGASDMAAPTGNSTKTKRKKSDQALTAAAANVPSSSSSSPTSTGHTSPVRLARGDSKRSSPGSSSPPPSVVVVPPTNSVSMKTPINIITDYGVMPPAPLTPSPSVKSPRGSPRGTQQQRASLVDGLEVDVRNQASAERRSGSQSPVNSRRHHSHSPSPKSPPKSPRSPKSPPRSPKSPASEQRDQKSPLSRVKKRLSLDIETAKALPASSGSASGVGRGRRRQLPQGSVGKSAKGPVKDSKKLASPTNDIIPHAVPPTPDTPVSVATVKPGKPGPKKGKSPQALSAKGPGRKRSLSSSSTGSQPNLKKASSGSAIVAVDSPMNSSQRNKSSPGASLQKKKKALGVVKTYPSRVRQSRLSLDSQLSHTGSTSPRSLSPKGTDAPKTLTKTSSPAKIKTPTTESVKETKVKAAPGPKRKTLVQKLAQNKLGAKGKGQLGKKSLLNSVLKIKLKPGRKPGFKLGTTKVGMKGKLKHARPGRPSKEMVAALEAAVKKAANSEVALVPDNEAGTKAISKKPVKKVQKQLAAKSVKKEGVTPVALGKGKGSPPKGTKPKGKPGRKPKVDADAPKSNLDLTIESVARAAGTSPTRKSPTIAQRKKSNLTIDVAKKLKTAAKKRVTLQAPLKTPRKRLGFLSPRSPRKSPRIILKDVIKLSKIEYDMAMTTNGKQISPKQSSPVSKKLIGLSKIESTPKPPKSDDPTKKEDGKETSVKASETKTQLLEKKPKVLSAQKKQLSKTSPQQKDMQKDNVSKKTSPVSKPKSASDSPAKSPVKKRRPPMDGQAKRGPKKANQLVAKLKEKKSLKRPISPDTSDEDVLYSLNPNYDGDDSESGSSHSPSTAPDAEVSKIMGAEGTSSAFPGMSPRKLLLKDSIKQKTKVVKPGKKICCFYVYFRLGSYIMFNALSWVLCLSSPSVRLPEN